MPPPKDILRCEKSTWSKPGVLSKPLKRVLTPVIAVKPSFEISRTNPAMSRGLVMSRLLQPILKKVRQFAVKAKM